MTESWYNFLPLFFFLVFLWLGTSVFLLSMFSECELIFLRPFQVTSSFWNLLCDPCIHSCLHITVLTALYVFFYFSIEHTEMFWLVYTSMCIPPSHGITNSLKAVGLAGSGLGSWADGSKLSTVPGVLLMLSHSSSQQGYKDSQA